MTVDPQFDTFVPQRPSASTKLSLDDFSDDFAASGPHVHTDSPLRGPCPDTIDGSKGYVRALNPDGCRSILVSPLRPPLLFPHLGVRLAFPLFLKT